MLSVSSDAFRIDDLHTNILVRQPKEMLREVRQEPKDSRDCNVCPVTGFAAAAHPLMLLPEEGFPWSARLKGAMSASSAHVKHNDHPMRHCTSGALSSLSSLSSQVDLLVCTRSSTRK